MERQANYVLVGVIGVVLLISAFVFVVWFAHFQFNQKYDMYQVHFRGPVSGLGKGAEVQLNGIKVGEITQIALDKKDANLVITDLQLESGTPVRVNFDGDPGDPGHHRREIRADQPGFAVPTFLAQSEQAASAAHRIAQERDGRSDERRHQADGKRRRGARASQQAPFRRKYRHSLGDPFGRRGDDGRAQGAQVHVRQHAACDGEPRQGVSRASAHLGGRARYAGQQGQGRARGPRGDYPRAAQLSD